MKLRKQIAIVLVVAVLILSCTTGAYATGITAFHDVQSEHWAYEAIMAMTSKSLFTGTSNPVNGIGTFSPDSIMTRAQFLTVLTRYLYSDELETKGSISGTTWYSKNYAIALENELLTASELDCGDLSKNCTRQEMAMLLTRAAKQGLDEVPGSLVPSSNIADYQKIDAYYQNYVLNAYSLGLLAGVDSAGTFEPHGVLTRAQAAVVIYRLMEPSTRNIVSTGTTGTFTWPNGIIYEGEYSNGEANGYGKMTFPDIGNYVGYFENGKRQGIGTFTWDVGDRYVGNWNADAMSGAGTYTFSDGYVIKGTWENNAIKIRNLAMNVDSVELAVGSKMQIVALCEPYYVTEEISWETSKKSVADISFEDNRCTIAAKATGNATITAKTADGKKCTCTVSVTPVTVPANQIALNHGDYVLDVGARVTLKATISPENATSKSVKWSSSDDSIAKVSSAGVVTAKNEGVAIISACVDNSIVATCYISVYDSKMNLFDGRWDIYDADEDGDKTYGYSWDYCLFDIDDMTVYFSGYSDYSYETLDLEQIDSYSLGTTYKFSDYTDSYELVFTSIDENTIILEETRYWYLLSSEPTVSYYVLERQ